MIYSINRYILVFQPKLFAWSLRVRDWKIWVRKDDWQQLRLKLTVNLLLLSIGYLKIMVQLSECCWNKKSIFIEELHTMKKCQEETIACFLSEIIINRFIYKILLLFLFLLECSARELSSPSWLSQIATVTHWLLELIATVTQANWEWSLP